MVERLSLRARQVDGAFAAVAVTSSRRLGVPAGLAGQPVARALTLLPMIFSLCGRAQGVAAMRAVEQALGITPTPAQAAARRLLLAAEALQELWTPVLMEWPAALGQTPHVEAARRLRRTLEPMWKDCALVEVDRVLLTLEPFAPGIGRDDLDAVHRAARRDRSPAGAMLRHLFDHGLEGFGACDLAPLPPNTDLGEAVAGDHAGTFRAAPTWRGAPAETGPLARTWDHPAVAAVRAAYGTGLLARAVARLVDMDDQMRTMRDAADALWQSGHNHCAVAPPKVPAAACGQGSGTVEAARGTLVHWVDLREASVRDWRILAPTEWNFHPAGPLVQGLTGAPTGTDPVARMRLMALALDPCVAHDVMVDP